MIEQLRQEQGYPVEPMCWVLGVSKSGYYAWRNREPSVRSLEDERLKVAIKAAHKRGRGTYGPEKIQDELADVEGLSVGVNRIKRLRRDLGIRCRQVKKYKVTTDSRHNLPVAANLLDQDFAVAGPGQAWVADITYIPTEQGWLYLAGIKGSLESRDRRLRHEPSHDAGFGWACLISSGEEQTSTCWQEEFWGGCF